MFGIKTQGVEDIADNLTLTPAYQVPYHIFDRLVNEYFKPALEYEYVADQEASNDMSIGYLVTGKLTATEIQDVQDWQETNEGTWMGRLLLDALCADGVIKPGVYYIDISW